MRTLTRQTALAFLVVLFSCFLVGCNRDTSQSGSGLKLTKEAKAAVDALRKLQLKTSVGVNFQTYTSAVADTLFPVTEYLKSGEGSKDNFVNDKIRTVAKDYVMASKVWTAKVDGTYLDTVASEVAREYSGIYVDDEEWLKPDKAIQMMWSHASKELAKLE